MTNGVNTPSRSRKPNLEDRLDEIDTYTNTQNIPYNSKLITITPLNHHLNNIKIFSNSQYFMEIMVFNTTLHLAERLPITVIGSDEHKTLWEKLLAATKQAKSLIADIHKSAAEHPNITYTDINPLQESLTKRLEDLETSLNKLTSLSIAYSNNDNP